MQPIIFDQNLFTTFSEKILWRATSHRIPCWATSASFNLKLMKLLPNETSKWDTNNTQQSVCTVNLLWNLLIGWRCCGRILDEHWTADHMIHPCTRRYPESCQNTISSQSTNQTFLLIHSQLPPSWRTYQGKLRDIKVSVGTVNGPQTFDEHHSKGKNQENHGNSIHRIARVANRTQHWYLTISWKDELRRIQSHLSCLYSILCKFKNDSFLFIWILLKMLRP